MIDIRTVTKEEEKWEIYHFRYRVYVELMNRKQDDADHDRKVIIDSLDKTCTLFGVYRGGEIIGTVRNNYSLEIDLGYYDNFYEMPRFGEYHPAYTCITTRLMIDQKVRSPSLLIKIFNACYDDAIKKNIRFNVIDCNDPVVEIFHGFGYQVMERKVHKEYGQVYIMVLDLLDFDLFKRSKSPFLSMRMKHKEKIEYLIEKFKGMPVEWCPLKAGNVE